MRIYWHPQGDYVAVQVDRYTKTRKSTYTSFELFSVKDKDIPMEVLELPNKTDKVIDFAWEPRVSGTGVTSDFMCMRAALLFYKGMYLAWEPRLSGTIDCMCMHAALLFYHVIAFA